jgi:hypothetical protein
MRRSITLVLIVGLVGLGTLCIAPEAFAQWWWGTTPSTTDTNTTPSTTNTNTTSTPEIDASAAAGVLTIVGGALALLGESLRRK